MQRMSTRSLVLTAILSALVIVMTVVPYTGYITVGIIEITTLHIVTILSGVLLGWQGGAVVGTVWGISCIARCLIAMPIYQPFGFANVFVALLPRTLVGTVAGLVFGGLKKTRATRTVSISLSAIAGTLTNTVLVLSAMTVYCKLHGMDGYQNATVYSTLSAIVASLAATNGLIELGTAIVLVPVIYFALEPKELMLGIDIGGSTTKLALVKGKKCLKTLRKDDEETLAEALDRFGTAGVRRIALTGVGADSITGNIRGIPTEHVEEFRAITAGIRKGIGCQNCVVVNIGTGTSFLRVTPIQARHLGGSGMGGGMLKGLCRGVFQTDDMETFFESAGRGDITKVDLVLADISQNTLSNLKPDTTVANLGKLCGASSREDAAVGLYSMVFQNLGVMAAFATKATLTRKVIVTGTIASYPYAPEYLKQVAELHNIEFIVPENAGFITAMGAAMALD